MILYSFCIIIVFAWLCEFHLNKHYQILSLLLNRSSPGKFCWSVNKIFPESYDFAAILNCIFEREEKISLK
jgi:hypothetical protein